MRRSVVVCSFCAVALSAAFVPDSADAAEFTDLMDAADDKDDFKEETYDPFDFSFEPRFTYHFSNAKITREAPCLPDASGSSDLVRNNPRLIEDRGRCSEPDIVYNKEMLYKNTRTQLDFALRVGLYKDLELSLNVPYVIDSTYGLKYANEDPRGGEFNVDESNSSIDPSTSRIQQHASNTFNEGDSYEQHMRNFDRYTLYRFFELQDDYRNFSRSGFADPTISLDWAPFNDQRDDTKATLLIGAGYKMPIAPIREADDTDVGGGMHELQFRIRSSKQFDWIEPYFGMEYFLPLAAGNSPIREYDPQNEGQVFVNSPQRGEITIGSEFIPYEDKMKGERYALDLRFTMGYVSEGLDYTPLYEHMANSECNDLTAEDVTPEFDGNGNVSNPDQVACGWVVQRPANGDPEPVYDVAQMSDPDQTRFSTDGIMTVEDHGTFSGLAGLYLQPSEYFQLKFLAQLEHRQEHFLSNSRTGRDTPDSTEATPDDTVDLTGEDAAQERNPIYNPTYDSAGQRFRVEEWNSWSFMVNAALQF
ncbi:MAG: hypothetical protein ACQEVA_13820 [Myxococcota bacterium]